MIYTFSTWLFFFYFYCFLGWIWETCYVSVLKAKWVNRGFMRGPFLPIYGSGAVVVLIFTLPFRMNAGLVFIVGMTSATLLEYFTGVAMEKMFHVRYWDYSSQRLNLNGHICVTSSLAWGAFSVILTLYGHTPIERFAMHLNRNLLEVIVFLLTVYLSIDMAESVREAFNLKEVLLSLEESSEEFRRLQKHFEIASAFYGGEIKERSEAGLRRINSALESGKEMYGRIGESSRNSKALMIEKMTNAKTKKEYGRMSSLLKRNPQAVSKMHEEAFSQFMEFSDEDLDG
ncbi:MAG: putative ABC transporter permease [Lachnospiraceae bacterium]|nr:putative ABC transporter permease [Lachnospiraceae bacterium]MDE7184581.1 putative ABC transporter permease [Lachnospiraceae bacterium]